jgi:hypothetical protein
MQTEVRLTYTDTKIQMSTFIHHVHSFLSIQFCIHTTHKFVIIKSHCLCETVIRLGASFQEE